MLGDIKVGQVYRDLRFRNGVDAAREIKVIQIGGSLAWVRNIATNRGAWVSLSRLAQPYRFALVAQHMDANFAPEHVAA